MTDPATLDGTGPPEPGEALLASVRRALAADYDVEREVGRGGMAVVFKGREKELERTVALKVLPPDLAPVSSIADRFKREARLAASLDHPNIIPVYRVGYTGGVLYMAMKYIDGRALDGLVASQGPLPLPVVLTVLRATARAMAYAHEHGIVHRDIKGANILIDRNGRVIVSDFGIARAMESAALTATGLMIGTPHYMSPEQCAGRPAGAQADQYSLGIVAYQLLTGAVPFDGESVPEILQQHCFTPAPDPSIVAPRLAGRAHGHRAPLAVEGSRTALRVHRRAGQRARQHPVHGKRARRGRIRAQGARAHPVVAAARAPASRGIRHRTAVERSVMHYRRRQTWIATVDQTRQRSHIARWDDGIPGGGPHRPHGCRRHNRRRPARSATPRRSHLAQASDANPPAPCAGPRSPVSASRPV